MRTSTVQRFMIRRQLGHRPLSLEEVAARCGLHPLLVERFVTLGLIDPVEGEPNRFAPEAPLRLQRAVRLRRDLGLSYNGAALVLDLLDRIEALERRLEQYERRAGFYR
jgi:DNA-binding transcriptional MerR regulator